MTNLIILKKKIEDLKERFYSIQSKLAILRGDEDSPYYNYSYDKNREISRKEQWEKLDERTKDQIKEEEELQIEMKRIEQQQKKKDKDRKKVHKLTQSVQQIDKKKKRNMLKKKLLLHLEN